MINLCTFRSIDSVPFGRRGEKKNKETGEKEKYKKKKKKKNKITKKEIKVRDNS